MTRIQVLILTLVFICGMFASTFAQQSKTETASATAERTGELPSDFAKFVPEEASFLFVYRPKQLADNEVIKQLTPAFDDSMHLFPGEPDQVELLIVASHHQAIERLFSYQAEQAFEKIADELADSDESTINRENKSTKTKANFLNENFSGLIRFESPSDWSLIKEWLNKEQPDDNKYSVKKWLGRELLESDCRDCCVVVRIDDRTFLVGNKERFTLAFHQNGNPDSISARWLAHLAKEKFRGDLYLGMDLKEAKEDWGDKAPQHGPWSMANQIDEVEFALDFTNSPLMTCKFNLTDYTSAAQFGAFVTTSFDEYRTMMNSAISDFDVDSDGQRKQFEQALEVLKSFSIENDKHCVIVKLPRPANFGNIISKYLTGVDESALQNEADFQAIADELEMAESVNIAEPATRKVVVMRRNIAADEIFTLEDVTYETWETARVPENSLPLKNIVVGLTATQQLMQGEPVLTNHLKASSN